MANWIPVLSLLPRNAISQAFGVVARLRLPIFSSCFRDWFVRQFHIDMSDATLAQKDYATVQELFVRELKPGARAISSDELVSPVDGRLSQCGFLDDSNLQMIQAKGRTYSLANLLRDPSVAERFRGGSWAVIYLAPFNYHRIHSPVAGTLQAAYYCPGTLWPVNVHSVARIDELFCVNERLTSHVLMENGGEVLVVKVGATNVGRISLAYTKDIVTNTSHVPTRRLPLSIWKPQSPLPISKAGQLGTFELGSTVVLVCSREVREHHPKLFQAWLGRDVRMGQSLN